MILRGKLHLLLQTGYGSSYYFVARSTTNLVGGGAGERDQGQSLGWIGKTPEPTPFLFRYKRGSASLFRPLLDILAGMAREVGPSVDCVGSQNYWVLLQFPPQFSLSARVLYACPTA